jgi:hypothetical protein
MVKPVYKFLIIITVVCLSVFFTISALSVVSQENFDEKEIEISVKTFPLEVNLNKSVFNVGEKMSYDTTITNKCGRDVNATYVIGMPCVFFYTIEDATNSHIEVSMVRSSILKANDKLTTHFEYEFTEAATYVFYAHYDMDVDGVAISDELEFVVEVN